MSLSAGSVSSLPREVEHDLQREDRLPGTRLAADDGDGPGREAAAQDSIQGRATGTQSLEIRVPSLVGCHG